MTQAEIDAIWDEAVQYNAELKLKNDRPFLTDAQKAKYEATLDVTGTGVMGYIEIPKIGTRMPIYHGVEEGVLAIAAGHLEWSSLPVGGKGTHCVLSGHRGLPSAKLFTDLPELNPGDTFVVRVLDRALTYRVDQIRTVLPEDIRELRPVKGKDYCTLVTCTPYGINTHRLLVRGVRVKNGEEAWSAIINDDALVVSLGIEAAIMAIPILLLILLGRGLKSLWGRG